MSSNVIHNECVVSFEYMADISGLDIEFPPLSKDAKSTITDVLICECFDVKVICVIYNHTLAIVGSFEDPTIQICYQSNESVCTIEWINKDSECNPFAHHKRQLDKFMTVAFMIVRKHFQCPCLELEDCAVLIDSSIEGQSSYRPLTMMKLLEGRTPAYWRYGFRTERFAHIKDVKAVSRELRKYSEDHPKISLNDLYVKFCDLIRSSTYMWTVDARKMDEYLSQQQRIDMTCYHKINLQGD